MPGYLIGAIVITVIIVAIDYIDYEVMIRLNGLKAGKG